MHFRVLHLLGALNRSSCLWFLTHKEALQVSSVLSLSQFVCEVIDVLTCSSCDLAGWLENCLLACWRKLYLDLFIKWLSYVQGSQSDCVTLPEFGRWIWFKGVRRPNWIVCYISWKKLSQTHREKGGKQLNSTEQKRKDLVFSSFCRHYPPSPWVLN